MLNTWNNLINLEKLTDEQLLDRIKYIEQLKDELEFEKWEIDWKSEYNVAFLELKKRSIIF